MIFARYFTVLIVCENAVLAVNGKMFAYNTIHCVIRSLKNKIIEIQKK